MSFFSTMPSLEDRIARHDNNFNVVRLLAAACVLYYHSFALSHARGFDAISTLVNPWSNAGGLPVGTFFLISGIFVTQSFFRKKSWLDFAIRRVFRIWPGFIFCLLFTATLAAVCEPTVGWNGFWRHSSYYDYIWKNAVMKLEFFIQGVFDHHPNQAVNGSIHTLVLEVKMYGFVLVISFMGSLVARWFVGLIGLMGVGISLGRPALLATWLDAPSYGVPPIALFFLGMLIFAIGRHVTLMTILAAAAVAVSGFTLTGHGLLAFWAGITALIVVLGAFVPPLPDRLLRNDYSYGIFLYGFPLQQLVFQFHPAVTPTGSFLVGIMGAAVMAAFSWHWIERPAMGAGRLIAEHLSTPSLRAQPGAAAGLLQRCWVPLALGLCIPLWGLGAFVATRFDLASVEPLAVSIVDFGPKETRVGQGINVQADGSSAMWLVLDRRPPAGTKVRIGRVSCDTIVGADSVATCRVPADVFGRAATVPIVLELRTARIIFRSNQVDFIVKEKPANP